MPTWLPWRRAMARAMYAPGGFYRSHEPTEHFATASQSGVYAAAIARLVDTIDLAEIEVVDLGAGHGELLTTLADLLPAHVELVGVDVRPRPAGLPRRVRWQRRLPERISGLLIANEWLDDVPVDIVTRAAGGVARQVLVDPRTGAERPGPPVGSRSAAWLDTWWRLAAPGERAEVGRSRDRRWARAVRHVEAGLAIAVDYDHARASRPPAGTLTGYASGRQVTPIPDGSCNLTAHVALDSCGAASGLPYTIRRQRDVLRALGVAATLPPYDATNPAGYVRALAAASEARHLMDAEGYGNFGWLIHPVGRVSLPDGLRR